MCLRIYLCELQNLYGAKYSRMDQVKLMEGSL